MSFPISRCDDQPERIFGVRRRPAANAGFTLIEVLVAIAVLAVTLPAIGAVVATTVRSVRAVDRNLPLLETAQSLLVSLPDRGALRPGSQSGALGDLRWRIDVVAFAMPLPSAALAGPASANATAPHLPPWMPLAITIRVQGAEGPPLRLDTVRLVPRAAG
jgi:general secretion pathway protein I